MIAETQDVCNITQHLFLSPRDPDKLRQLNNNTMDVWDAQTKIERAKECTNRM